MPPLEHIIPEDELEKLSTLQLLDIISHKLAVQGALPSDMSILRRRVEEMEDMQDQARTAVEKLSEGIRIFYADARKLEKYAQTEIAKANAA